MTGRARRDLASRVAHRLARFKRLSARQLRAAERLERDWAAARLEPRLIADLQCGGTGGGAAAGVRDAVLDARDRVHGARSALRRGGPEVLRVVEGVVILEATADSLGAAAYAARRDASIHVRALLGVGLNLLADWYAEA
jgi:hypothetical protein